MSDKIEGVGVIYFPQHGYQDADGNETHAVDVAKTICRGIRKGSIIAMPSTRDSNGHLLWDFKIEGGDPRQVEIRRSDEIDRPVIVRSEE